MWSAQKVNLHSAVLTGAGFEAAEERFSTTHRRVRVCEWGLMHTGLGSWCIFFKVTEARSSLKGQVITGEDHVDKVRRLRLGVC